MLSAGRAPGLAWQGLLLPFVPRAELRKQKAEFKQQLKQAFREGVTEPLGQTGPNTHPTTPRDTSGTESENGSTRNGCGGFLGRDPFWVRHIRSPVVTCRWGNPRNPRPGG